MENVTYDDYCNHYAAEQACNEESYAHDAFTEFLEFVGAEEARESEWGYSVQCRGLVARMSSDVHDGWCIPNEPCKVDSARDSFYYSLSEDLDNYWNEKAFPELETQYRKIDILGEAHRVFFANDCNGYWECEEYRNTLDALDSAYWDSVNAYVVLFESHLESVCSIVEKAFRDIWDYAYSEEAYEDFYCAYCA